MNHNFVISAAKQLLNSANALVNTTAQNESNGFTSAPDTLSKDKEKAPEPCCAWVVSITPREQEMGQLALS